MTDALLASAVERAAADMVCRSVEALRACTPAKADEVELRACVMLAVGTLVGRGHDDAAVAARLAELATAALPIVHQRRKELQRGGRR